MGGLRVQREPALLVAAALTALLLVMGCPVRQELAPVKQQVRQGGSSIRVLQRSGASLGRAAGGRSGDWLIESLGLMAVVGAERAPGSNGTAGVLLDVTRTSWDRDTIESLRTGIELGGRAVPMHVATVRLVEHASGVAVRVEQRDATGTLELDTEITPARDGSALDLRSKLRNASGRVRSRVRIVDQVRWLGSTAFAPGVGRISHGRHTVDWVVLPGERQSYVLQAAAPLHLFAEAALHPPSALVAGGTEVELGARAEARFDRRLLVSDGSLVEASRLAWETRGAELGTVSGTFQPVPRWAVVSAFDERGALVIERRAYGAADYSLPLPPGRYRIRLDAPGGNDEAAVQVVARTSVDPRLLVPEPARLSYRVHDAKGAPIPARLLVRGAAGTPDPDLGPVHVASGAGFAAYTASGSGTLELPEGRYAIHVSHGVEYATAVHEVSVSRTRGATLRAELAHLVPTPGYIACDFHVHAEPSPDSDVTLVDRVTSLLAEHVEFAAATDHNHVTSYAAAIGEMGAAANITSTSGVEITTPTWGHFNAFPYPEGEPPPFELPPEAVFAAVRERAPNSVLQVNHPRMGDIGYFVQGGFGDQKRPPRAGFSLNFDAVEVFNGFDLAHRQQVEDNIQEWYRLLALGRRVVAVGNSDSHTLLYQWAGYPRTYVASASEELETIDARAIADSLRAGRAFVTNGPILQLTVDGRGPGEHVTARTGRVRVRIMVRAAPWVDVDLVRLVVRGGVSDVWPVVASDQVNRFEREHELEIAEDTWLLAIASGSRPLDAVLPGANALPLAFTNPVYVEFAKDAARQR